MADINIRPFQASPEDLNKGSSVSRGRIDPGIKAVALSLLYVLPGLLSDAKYRWIKDLTGVSERHLTRIAKEAKARGYDPITNPGRVLMEYVIEAPRSGRPNMAVNEVNERKCIEIVSRDRNGREKSAEVIGMKFGISRQSVCRIMRRAGYKKVKSITKPAFNEKTEREETCFCEKISTLDLRGLEERYMERRDVCYIRVTARLV
jgi:hypothetical protein